MYKHYTNETSKVENWKVEVEKVKLASVSSTKARRNIAGNLRLQGEVFEEKTASYSGG